MAALLVLGLSGWLNVTTVAAGSGCRLAVHPGVGGGRWASSRVARFSNEAARPLDSRDGQEVTAYAIVPDENDRMLVTNGATVLRSTDGGCAWEKIFATPAIASAAVPFPNARVSSIVVGKKGQRNRVYLTITSDKKTGLSSDSGEYDADLVSSSPFRLLVSADDGRSWEGSNDGLPPFGQFPMLQVAPGNPRVAYLAVQLGLQVQTTSPDRAEAYRTLIYRSTDAGESWKLRSDFISSPGSGNLHAGGAPGSWFGLKVDPVDSKELWAWDPTIVQRSHDGGRSWVQVKGLETGQYGEGATALDVDHIKGQSARVVVAPALFCANVFGAIVCPEPFVFRSNDGGKTWRKLAAPGFVASAAHAGKPHSLVVLTRANEPGQQRYPGRVFVLTSGGKTWVDISPSYFLPGLDDLIFIEHGAGALYARATVTVERYSGRFL